MTSRVELIGSNKIKTYQLCPGAGVEKINVGGFIFSVESNRVFRRLVWRVQKLTLQFPIACIINF